jgi:hypothetical protein
VKLSNQLRTRELSYLHEDLTKSILRIQNSYSLEHYDISLLAQIQEKLALLSPIHIGAPAVLDAIQYLLGEMRTGLWEDEPLYCHLDALIEQIQDYLDWVEG